MSDKYYSVKEDRYRRFVFTLQQCGKFLVDASDDTIETCIFEDFDIGIRGDLCDENLDMFIYEGWISEEIKSKCLKLQSLFLNIHSKQPQIWNIQSVRTSEIWREVLELSDEIKALLYYQSTG